MHAYMLSKRLYNYSETFQWNYMYTTTTIRTHITVAIYVKQELKKKKKRKLTEQVFVGGSSSYIDRRDRLLSIVSRIGKQQSAAVVVIVVLWIDYRHVAVDLLKLCMGYT